MRHHFLRNYHIIRVMFWSFPYLLWQAFGHWSGFLVGVIVAVILTMMFNSLFRAGNWDMASSQAAESQAQHQEVEAYQRGYRAKAEPYAHLTGELQPQYEEMQVLYPQEEMPPME